MAVFEPIALGRPIPERAHAVSCSLPTMAAVRGYEEKDPEVVRQLATGYPRFVVHPLARRLAQEAERRLGLEPGAAWLAASARMADRLSAHLAFSGDGHKRIEALGAHGVAVPPGSPAAQRARHYLQHVGGFLSSREAEDLLVAAGLLAQAAPEESAPARAVEAALLPRLAGAGPRDLFLATSGMNAIHAAFCAVNEVQAPRGRTAWIQLGWLYLDTIAILRKFTGGPGDYLPVSDVCDLGALRRVLAARGTTVAGVMAEIPTNPLVQTPDVAELSALCRAHGVHLVLDPSVSSLFSVDCLRHADVLTNSLTKYTGSAGDVISGLLCVNPAGPDADLLRAAAARHIEPPYARDLSRLAAQVGDTERVLATIEANTAQVAAFLSAHPRVAAVHWAMSPKSAAAYGRIARRPGACGGVMSFSVKGPMAPVYDRLRLPKGPSFGMASTLLCPFMYLAHYDLVTTAPGRAELAANGLDPDLLRLSVGAEPVGEIIAALSEALG